MCNLHWCYTFCTGVSLELMGFSQPIRIKYFFLVCYKCSLYYYDFKASRSTSTSGPPSRSKFNLVGPRDYRSNIRKIIYAKSKDETRQVSHIVYQKSGLIEINQIYHVFIKLILLCFCTTPY